MTKIGVFGANFDNKGAEAMILTLNNYLKKELNKEFTLIMFYDSKIRDGFVAPDKNFKLFQGPLSFFSHWMFALNVFLHKWFRIILLPNQSEIVKRFNECSIMVDLSGFALTDDFSKNSGTRRGLIYLSQALSSKLTGKKYVILPQAIGPFKRKLNLIIVKFIIYLSDLVYNRGRYKFNPGKKLQKKCIQTTDIVFHKSFIDNYNIKETKKTKKQVILNPNARIYHKSESGDSYIEGQIKIVNKLINEGFDVLLTPNEIRENEFDDLQICKIIKNKFPNHDNVELNENINIEHLLKLIISSDFIITSRFHLMVFSLIVNRPPIVISWSEKYYDIMTSFGIKKFCVDTYEPALEMIDYLIEDFENIKEVMSKSLIESEKLIDNGLKSFLKLV